MLRYMFIVLLSVFVSSACAQPFFTKIVPSESVTLRDPSALSMAPDGSLIVSDTGNNRVLSISRKGKLLFEIGSMGSGQGEFLWPRDVAAESGIVIWVADYGNRRVTKLSRQFELQGNLIVRDESTGSAEQIDRIAASPQGDIYLYAEDSGRLLRYDPLFSLKGSLGSNLGESYIPKVRQLLFIPDKGVVWHSRGDKYLSFSDNLLTQASVIHTELKTLDDYVFTAAGKDLIAAAGKGVMALGLNGEPVRELLSQEQLKAAGIEKIADIIVTSDEVIYILESGSASIYSVILNNH